MKRKMKLIKCLMMVSLVGMILIACQKKIPIATPIVGPSDYFSEQQIKEAIDLVEQDYQKDEYVEKVTRIEFNEPYSMEQMKEYAKGHENLTLDKMKDAYIIISTDMKTTAEGQPLESSTEYPNYDFLLKYDENDGWKVISGGTGLFT